ncbi:MAG TPA: glycosyltransferase family 4 protein [Actinomycetota bacterium]|nr:glycosyltransferase family 4 protein [Actinomycetota bacterium]
MHRPRVVLLTAHLPFPPISGGRRREYELIRRLGDRADIDLCAISKTPQEDRANAPRLEHWCRSVAVFPALSPDAPGRRTDPWVVRRHRAPGAAEHIRTRLDEADLVHLEGFYLSQHLPLDLPVAALLVEHNVEYLLWRQRAAATARRAERARHLLEYARTLEAEIAAWKRASIVGALTPEDREAMLQADHGLDVRLLPNGSDLRAPEPSGEDPIVLPKTPRIAFVANFAYQPNVDAALHLARDILPRIRKAVPEVALMLVGNGPPDEVRALAGDGIVVTGRVPSVAPYLAAADVVVCPLRVGGGAKVKISEAIAEGKAIVTTSVGAQGLPEEASRCMRIEDRPAPLARAVVELLRDPPERRRLERAASELAASLPTWDEAADRVLACYQELTTRRLRSVRGAAS